MLGSAVSLEDLSPSRFFFFFCSDQQTNPTECQRLNNHDGKKSMCMLQVNNAHQGSHVLRGQAVYQCPENPAGDVDQDSGL